jgi:hypothetical protein
MDKTKSKNRHKFFAQDRPDVVVRASSALAAAMKLYRMHKPFYAAAGSLQVVDEAGAATTFAVADWCQHASNKFVSKPK